MYFLVLSVIQDQRLWTKIMLRAGKYMVSTFYFPKSYYEPRYSATFDKCIIIIIMVVIVVVVLNIFIIITISL